MELPDEWLEPIEAMAEAASVPSQRVIRPSTTGCVVKSLSYLRSRAARPTRTLDGRELVV